MFFHWHFIYDPFIGEMLGGGVIIFLFAISLLCLLFILYKNNQQLRKDFLRSGAITLVCIVTLFLFPRVDHNTEKEIWKVDSLHLSTQLINQFVKVCTPFDSLTENYKIGEPHYFKTKKLFIIPVIIIQNYSNESTGYTCFWLVCKKEQGVSNYFYFITQRFSDRKEMKIAMDIKSLEAFGNYYYIPGTPFKNKSFWDSVKANIKYMANGFEELHPC